MGFCGQGVYQSQSGGRITFKGVAPGYWYQAKYEKQTRSDGAEIIVAKKGGDRISKRYS